jgi:ParB family chromosome partitioning protein
MSAVFELKHLAPSFALTTLEAPSPTPSNLVLAVNAGSTDALITDHATIRTALHGSMVRSKLNVRRKATDVTELAALICAQGLLQNLVGFPEVIDNVNTGIIEIVAGGRRHEAIGMLIEKGLLPQDYRIPYILVTEDEAIETSMAENRGRENMHPADVYEAMRELTARGRSIEDIAISFNLETLTVKRCLKLGNISPRLLSLYRDDEANFEQMMALAISDSHVAQELAWDSLNKHSRYAYELRRLLTAQQINVQSDRLARYVGVEAFEKAGGVVVRDLFSDSGAGYISDAALLERLALAKLEKHRSKLTKEGFTWVEVIPRADFAMLSEFGRVRTSLSILTDEQQAQVAALDEQLEKLQEQIEASGDDGGDECKSLCAQVDKLEDERKTISESRISVVNPDDKALAGAVVTLDDSGNVVVKRDLIRPADKAKMVKQGDEATVGVGGRRVRPVHSDRLTHVLTSHRTVALQAELMDRPDIALVVLTHTLISRLLKPYGNHGLVAKLTTTQPSLAEETKETAADVAFTARRQKIIERLPSDEEDGDWLAWLHLQPQSVVLELMAFCVACSLDTTQTREGNCAGFTQLAQSLNLDMGKWWKASAADYFNHVSKERAMAVVAQGVSAEAAVPLEKMKKAAAAEAAERALSSSSWLPEALRTT